jgi:hypothetical protein
VNAVFILWLRQLKRYFRSRARMIGSLGQPTLFLLALGFGLGHAHALLLIRSHRPQIPRHIGGKNRGRRTGAFIVIVLTKSTRNSCQP